MKGAWDSIHVVEVKDSGKTATYKLTSTVLLYMKTDKPGHGEMNLSGSMTRQVICSLLFSPKFPPTPMFPGSVVFFGDRATYIPLVIDF